MTTKSKNEALVRRLEGIRHILMAHHEAGSMLPNAAKGTEREVLIREFLGQVFPTPFRFGSGAVIDSSGRVSGQLDIVVEFPFFPSFPTPGAVERLYLAESVAFILEVKSDLSAQWDQIERSVEKVRPLRRSWRGHLQFKPSQFGGSVFGQEAASTSRIPYVAVGFRGDKSPEALDERLKSTAEDKRPDAALVLDSGAFVDHFNSTRGSGAEGLFGLCTAASYFATNVLIAVADFRGYFTGDALHTG